ncbi:stage V sporulation protein AE [Aquibacillus sp. 3ASR75-11]|uniref:Stage V sporulation protein AE n=1 Tax=Terrihalobacillus insolitus TaxID=2950438 RepID=A0A9X3WWT6_9BACI|nr:stage V sporulation protein AE [Terrihalobacillus insolitus]MDC3413102.1 stage V sporulation protein AE [Terrihalobacillus insolitus]MDC3424844.1 stage V sporulation protein AE [Terrihalobacillus insolitus]
MSKKKRIIVITDGDEYARKTLDYLANELGGTCLSYLSDNPTVVTPDKVIRAVLKAKEEPVYVLIDDAGIPGVGAGEKVLLALKDHPDIDIIGAIAVAAHTKNMEWTRFSFAIDRYGQLTANGVDKEGVSIPEIGRINGDTVYSLDQLDLPIVIAIGDIGKMHGNDDLKKGSPITRKAIELILERGEQFGSIKRKSPSTE